MNLHRLTLTAALSLALAASAAAQSVSSTVLQFNGATAPGDGQNQQLSTVNPAELTVPTGWDFTGQDTLTSIGFIQITLTLTDGDSAFGDFDFNHLFLALDGVNTGLALNGFRGGGLLDTLTLSGTIDAATSTALLAQFGDQRFVGTIVTDRSDSVTAPNDLFVGNDTNDAVTTLVVAVPEPGTYALLGAGLLLVLGPQVRRFRRNL